jgi:hypothetical protein
VRLLAAGKSHRTNTDRRPIRFEEFPMRAQVDFGRRDLGERTIADLRARRKGATG